MCISGEPSDYEYGRHIIEAAGTCEHYEYLLGIDAEAVHKERHKRHCKQGQYVNAYVHVYSTSSLFTAHDTVEACACVCVCERSVCDSSGGVAVAATYRST